MLFNRFGLIKSVRLLTLWCSLFLSSCFENRPQTANVGSDFLSTGLSASGQPFILPQGKKSAKIIFQESVSFGSFDRPSTNGTAIRYGQLARRVFDPRDGSLMATDPNSPGWPKWLTSLEVGISGSNNQSADHPDCARFADPEESVNSICGFGQNTFHCGAPPHFFRISEYDCSKSNHAGSAPSTRIGTGGGDDGVYIRVTLNRDLNFLAPQENIMAVLEYSAAALSTLPADVQNCWRDPNLFTPSDPGCSPMTWQTYLKHSLYEVTQPFLMLAPPTHSYANSSPSTTKNIILSKQFILPLASDAGLSVFQISRIRAVSNTNPDSDFSKLCTTNSPLCLGMVFYSITFYRI